MATQYDLMKSVSPKGKEEESVLYPKVVPYGTKTLKDIMKIKDPVERQRMIGQNLNLFGKEK